MKLRALVVIVGVATAAAGLGVAVAADSKAGAKAEIGKTAPDFELKDTFGKPFKLSDFKGKIVVLEWINRNCPVSRACHEKSLMQKTYSQYAAKGVIWLAIDTTVGTDAESNRVYAADQRLAYPILHDADGKVGRAYAAATTPHMYVIDKKGILVYTGAIDDRKDKNYVSAALEAVLAGREVAASKTKPYGCSVKYPPEDK
jgi:peroxiredoxin